MKRIELPRPLAIQLLNEAMRSPDDEVCGLIAAGAAGNLRLIPVANAARDPQRMFDMEERQLVDAMKSIRGNGEELFAIYHSHPQSAPVPSTEDIRQSQYPDVLHLIISLQTKGVLEMRGWYLRKQNAEAVDVGVAENT